jgi:hypothetical protein
MILFLLLVFAWQVRTLGVNSDDDEDLDALIEKCREDPRASGCDQIQTNPTGNPTIPSKSTVIVDPLPKDPKDPITIFVEENR